MQETASVSARDVSKVFGQDRDRVVALDEVSLDIAEGEFFTLLGPSGCGKTTLLRLIAGFEHPTSGAIRLYGEEISHLPPFLRPVNTVFQSYALFPHMSVAENIGFGLEMQDKPAAEIESTVSAMLELVRMEALRNRRTDQISGGQQQRVALARALAPRPRVLLLDEPLSALDYKLRKEMQIELKRLQHETGITFIFVTHDQEEALTMSDRIAVMSSGRVLQTGTPREIYDHPSERFVADFIGDINFLSAKVVEVSGDSAVLELPSGRTVTTEARVGQSAGDASIAIRPEQAHLVDAGAESELAGRVANVVYSGTDTHFHLELDGGEAFVVRVQNSARRFQHYETGRRVGVALDEGAVQILKD